MRSPSNKFPCSIENEKVRHILEENICETHTRSLYFHAESIKNSQNSTIRKQIIQWAKYLNRHFIKEDIKISNKHTTNSSA
jgi:hypothetical protein